ncbi:SAF domain-containing protein [Virgisporangium aurantiacum]|uniref:SAF domain-containing protein n=1 Tax=Virgisporangium aurantiacum TaxID=175570 RepID=UPI001EF2D165|nr:SAF domain-containing protein [Virgisporangium aurantiacum]
MTRRRISVPWVLVGAVLILGFALAGTVVADRIDRRVPVLAAARAINAGQIIGDADVTVVRVAAEARVATVPASHVSSVKGRAAAVPLAAGSLLAPGQIGEPAWPPAGQAVIAVAVKAGHAPSSLVRGARVSVLVVSANAGAAPAGAVGQVVQAAGVVVSIETAVDQSGLTVVTLLLAEPDATRVASAAGDVSLVQLGGGG